MKLSKQDLLERAYDITAGNISDLSREQIEELMTVTQYVTDLCLNELERRGQLADHDGAVMVPYVSDHMVETILTRGTH